MCYETLHYQSPEEFIERFFDKNKSNNDRKILYYTYAESNNSDIYDEYYKDKDESITNKGGAL